MCRIFIRLTYYFLYKSTSSLQPVNHYIFIFMNQSNLRFLSALSAVVTENVIALEESKDKSACAKTINFTGRSTFLSSPPKIGQAGAESHPCEGSRRKHETAI